MAKPNPPVLLQDQTKEEFYEVCGGVTVWAVFYGDEPVKIRKTRLVANYDNFKYIKTMFPGPGHARRLAQRLNERFQTDKFTARRLG